MKPVRIVQSPTVVLADDNIDTDRIIPARFLTTTDRQGLGRHCFADWRRDESGRDNPDLALNRPQAKGWSNLGAGRNFGCGSSREHAPWALVDYGIQAVSRSARADLFRNNARKNGLLAIAVDSAAHQWLLDHPGADIRIDVERQAITAPGGRRWTFELDPFARHCLLNGVDQLGFLLNHRAAIQRYEARRAVFPQAGPDQQNREAADA